MHLLLLKYLTVFFFLFSSISLSVNAISPLSYFSQNIFPENFSEDDINFTLESISSLFNKSLRVSDIKEYNENYLSSGRTNDIFIVNVKTKSGNYKYIKRLAKYHFDNTDSQEAIYEASQSAINVYYDLKNNSNLNILDGMIPEFGTFHKISGNAVNKQPRYIVSQEYIHGLNVHDQIKTIQNFINNPLELDNFSDMQKEIITLASDNAADNETAVANCRNYIRNFSISTMEFFFDFWNKSGGYTILDVPESLILNIVYDLKRHKFIIVDLDVLSKMDKRSFLPDKINNYSRFRDYKNEILSLFYKFSQEMYTELKDRAEKLHEKLILTSNQQGKELFVSA